MDRLEGLKKLMAGKVRIMGKDFVAAFIEWIAVTEKLPTEKGRKYLVASPGTVYIATREGSDWADIAAYKGSDGQLVRYALKGITHWAELPAVPTLKVENEAN